MFFVLLTSNRDYTQHSDASEANLNSILLVFYFFLSQAQSRFISRKNVGTSQKEPILRKNSV